MKTEQREKPGLRSWIEVDLQAIVANGATIKAYTKNRLIAVLKADAYGHGAIPTAEALDAIADMFAVATVEEGIELREAGVSKPILILSSPLLALAEEIAAHNLTVAVDNWALARKLNKVASTSNLIARGKHSKINVTKNIKVHVDVNTGMNRSGVHCTEARTFLNRLKTQTHLEIDGVFTHFATADEASFPTKTCQFSDNSFTAVQLKRFTSLLKSLQNVESTLIHAANSAALLAIPESHFDAVRPGLSLYGIYPSHAKPISLQPALTWKARVGWVDFIEAGEGVSYGLTYRASRRTHLAVLQVGYGDGYPHSLSNCGTVLIAGKRRRITGSICMDMTVVQLDATDNVAIGDEAVLIGKQGDAEIGIDEVATAGGTIPYEILTRISHRVKHVYS